MAVQISGVLKDGTGKPVPDCTIQLKATRTSATVVVNTVASENPDEAGRYRMDVEPGHYAVTLRAEGYPPSYAGNIVVREDSQPGTLNDFLGAVNEDDLRPDVLQRFEEIAGEINRLAEDVRNRHEQTRADTKTASEAAETALQSARGAAAEADKSQKYAEAAAKSEATAGASAGTAEQYAQQAGDDLQGAVTARNEAEAFARQAGEAAEEAETQAGKAGEHAAEAKKYADELKEQEGKTKISASTKNLLSQQADGLFVNGTHPVIPKMVISSYTTSLYQNSLKSLADGTRVYQLSLGVSNPLKMKSYGGIGLAVAPVILPQYLYLNAERKYIPVQCLVDTVYTTASEVKIELKVVMADKPHYAVDPSTLEIVGECDEYGNIVCKFTVRLLVGTTLRQSGME